MRCHVDRILTAALIATTAPGSAAGTTTRECLFERCPATSDSADPAVSGDGRHAAVTSAAGNFWLTTIMG